jgi:hypothetical protein
VPALRRAQGEGRVGDEGHRLLEAGVGQFARQARIGMRNVGGSQPDLADEPLRVDAVQLDKPDADQAEGGEEGFGGHFRSVMGSGNIMAHSVKRLA